MKLMVPGVTYGDDEYVGGGGDGGGGVFVIFVGEKVARFCFPSEGGAIVLDIHQPHDLHLWLIPGVQSAR